MASHLDFLSFRGQDSPNSFTDYPYDALMNRDLKCSNILVDEKLASQHKTTLHEAVKMSSMQFITIMVSNMSAATFSLDDNTINHGRDKKWSNTNALKEHILVSSKCGYSCGKVDGKEKTQSILAQAAKVELANLMAQKEAIPRPAFFCYPDYTSNLQKLKGISMKILVPVGTGDHYEDMDLHLAFSESQIQSCIKISSSASKLALTSNPRTCETEDVPNYLNSGCIKGQQQTHKPYYGMGGLGKTNLRNMIKTIHQPPSAPLYPKNELVPANHDMARKTSTAALLVTICVVSTFVAALGFSSSSFKEAHLTGQDTNTSRSIIAMNSLVFVVSLVTDMFLLNEFKHKWEIYIILFALFGGYICLMKVMIPEAALPLFLLSLPFLLFAAAKDVVHDVE